MIPLTKEIIVSKLDYQLLPITYIGELVLKGKELLPYTKDDLTYLLSYEGYEDKDIYFRVMKNDREVAVHGALITGTMYLIGEQNSTLTADELNSFIEQVTTALDNEIEEEIDDE